MKHKQCSEQIVLRVARQARAADSQTTIRKGILWILSNGTHAGDDILVPKIDETYRGAGRRLLQLIEKRKDEIQRRKALRS